MASTATPISAAAKQQHQYQDEKDQIHRKSPIGFIEGTAWRELSSGSLVWNPPLTEKLAVVSADFFVDHGTRRALLLAVAVAVAVRARGRGG
jgi:hypothetical protein